MDEVVSNAKREEVPPVKFSISKPELLKALKNVQRAVPTRTTKMVLYGVLMTAESDQLTVTAYDLELGIQSVITTEESATLDITEDGAIVLNARYLIEIVQKLPDKGVNIETSGLMATIRSGKAAYTLNGMDYREYPPFPIIASDQMIPIPVNELTELIEHTVFATTASEIRPTLQGVNVRFQGSEVSFTATDSHRLAKQTKTVLLAEQWDESIIVPGKSLLELSKILPDEGEVNLQLVDYQLLIHFHHTYFYTRLIEGNYPDIDRIFPEKFVANIEVSGSAFNDCIERAALLARDNENQVVVIKVESRLQVTARSSEIGKVTEIVDTERFDGEPMSLACNAKFMMDALKAIGATTVEIGFTGPGSALVLRAKNDESQHHLVLPVRIGNG